MPIFKRDDVELYTKSMARGSRFAHRAGRDALGSDVLGTHPMESH